MSDEQVGMNACPECEHQVPSGACACPSCRVELASCPGCFWIGRRSAKFCRNCGEPRTATSPAAPAPSAPAAGIAKGSAVPPAAPSRPPSPRTDDMLEAMAPRVPQPLTTNDCPVQVWIQVPYRGRKHHRGVINVQATTTGYAELIVHFESRGKHTPEVQCHTHRIRPGTRKDLGCLDFHSDASGLLTFNLSLWVTNVEGNPIGRWVGQAHVSVAEGNEEPIRALDDFDRVTLETVFGEETTRGPRIITASSIAEWHSVHLQRDDPSHSRNRTADDGVSAVPWSEFGWEPPSEPCYGLGRINISTPRMVHPMIVLCRIGSHATMGKGGNVEVDWTIDPHPLDSEKLARLSRHHATLDLAQHNPWITDCSVNGLSIDSGRIAKNSRFALAHGASLALAPANPPHFRSPAVDLSVCLHRSHDAITAVGLERTDALQHRVCYLLSSNTALVSPIPALRGVAPEGLWLGWRLGPDHQLELACHASNAKTSIPSGQTAKLGVVQIRWEQGRFAG